MNIEKHPQQKYFDKIILYMLYTLLDAMMERPGLLKWADDQDH